METDLIEAAKKYFSRDELLHIDMSQPLYRGHAKVIAADAGGVVTREERSGIYALSASSADDALRLMEGIDPGYIMTLHQEYTIKPIAEKYGFIDNSVCYQVAYTKKEPLDEDGAWEVRTLGIEFAEQVWKIYDTDISSIDEIKWQLERGYMIGAFDNDGELAGFVGMHTEGAMGALTVRPEYRRRGAASALERRNVNAELERGWIPFGQVFADNDASMALQRSMGMSVASGHVYWIWK